MHKISVPAVYSILLNIYTVVFDLEAPFLLKAKIASKPTIVSYPPRQWRKVSFRTKYIVYSLF